MQGGGRNSNNQSSGTSSNNQGSDRNRNRDSVVTVSLDSGPSLEGLSAAQRETKVEEARRLQNEAKMAKERARNGT